MNIRLRAAALGILWVVAGPARADEPIDTSHIVVKKALADTLTPEQLAAHKERLARHLASAPLRRFVPPSDAPGDTCQLFSNNCYGGSLLTDTTVGATDDYDLPPAIVNPTCTASTSCTGAGPASSLPRGAIYAGTGTGPDRAWRLQTLANCTVTVTATPTQPWDLALLVYQGNCSDQLSDCVCADDTDIGGVAESVTLDAVAGVDYFIVVDGYGFPPGSSGPYTLHLSPVCCIAVELQQFAIE